jgi:hypothetical protein
MPVFVCCTKEFEQLIIFLLFSFVGFICRQPKAETKLRTNEGAFL